MIDSESMKEQDSTQEAADPAAEISSQPATELKPRRKLGKLKSAAVALAGLVGLAGAGAILSQNNDTDSGNVPQAAASEALNPTINPSESVRPVQTEQITPTPSASSENTMPDEQQTIPKVAIPEKLAEYNYNRLTNRTELSQKDLDAETSLLSKYERKPDQDLVIFENENVNLIYVSVAPGYFNAEIRNTDTDLAKKQLEDWFMQQSLSQDAICNGIGLEYYLSPEVKDSLPEGSTYDPNPLLCKTIDQNYPQNTQ